jgi:repressor LexA
MFADNLLKIMQERKVSQRKLANDIGFGINQIKYWKDHNSHPKADVLTKISDYFGVTVDYLLGNEAPPLNIEKGELVMLNPSVACMVPLYESVSAGFGAYASDTVEDYMPAYFHNPSEAKETICIKVRGDSMFPKIEDGDIIQVHKQDTVDGGDIAVVLLDGDEGLVKRVEFLPSAVVLHSINPMYPPMRFDGKDASRVRVVGLVTQVVKGINGRKINSAKVGDNKKELLDVIEKMNAQELKEFNKVYNDYLKSKEQ